MQIMANNRPTINAIAKAADPAMIEMVLVLNVEESSTLSEFAIKTVHKIKLSYEIQQGRASVLTSIIRHRRY